ncbi:hypothetical protein K9M43_04750, partial [Candidatus Gracilibacteria bacterium]|nr:hypothetical protein [Candidatus Gracilibacteria bacterium]MCF7896808.1 hypothetical protein [Candidatus Gracilibacteria bacterium]
ISVNADGESGEDDSPDCSGVGFCDRSFELRNQLYWKGLIATQNTIGGSDKAAPKCPAALESACETACTGNLGHNCKRNLARPYDLAYLRTFHSASGGTQIYSNSEAALVVEYDSRIQSNPPPLFETSSGSGSNQLGGDLLGTKNINQVARRSWLDVVLEWFGW